MGSLAGHYDLHNFTKTRGTNLPANLSSRNCFPLHSHNPFKIPACGGLFLFFFLMGKVFGQKLLMEKVSASRPPPPGEGFCGA